MKREAAQEDMVGDGMESKKPGMEPQADEAAAVEPEAPDDEVAEPVAGATAGRGKQRAVPPESVIAREPVGQSRQPDQDQHPAGEVHNVEQAEGIDSGEVKMRDEREFFEKLFRAMDRYRDPGWTLGKIRANSASMRPLLGEIEDLLEGGGISSKDTKKKLLTEVLTQVREAKGFDDFFRSISKRGAMPAGSTLAEFHDAFIAGREAQRHDEIGDDVTSAA
ncbi:MAG: hypothetical protein WC505_00965 [Patescibacteria group bacterium]